MANEARKPVRQWYILRIETMEGVYPSTVSKALHDGLHPLPAANETIEVTELPEADRAHFDALVELDRAKERTPNE